MVTIQIGDSMPHNLAQADAHWINEQINRRRKEGLQITLEVRIQEGDADLFFRTPAISGRGGGKKYTPLERQIIDLWVRHGLSNPGFPGGELVAFVTHLRKLL